MELYKLYEENLLGIFDVRGGLGEVSLLFVQQTQLIEREGDQVVIISDTTLTERAHKHTDMR